MTNKLEVQQRELYRQYVQHNAIERAAMEKNGFDYFLTARPLRPPSFMSNPLAYDRRFKKIYSFLAAKGYFNEWFEIFRPFRRKLKFEDSLWACENVDQRLFQLLPAILIRFPLHFKSPKQLPQDLDEVISHLKSGAEAGPDYHDYPFKLLKSWLWFQPRDIRCHRVPGSRLSVRLDPDATRTLASYCDANKFTRSEAIHLAISKLGV